MNIEVMKQALEALDCIDSPLRVQEINKVGAAMASLRQAIAEAEKHEVSQEPVAVISAKQLSSMFQDLKGVDTSQSGYDWRAGWNAALRQAMASLRQTIAEAEQERNFCPRCGKRTNDIHTCTPPQGDA